MPRMSRIGALALMGLSLSALPALAAKYTVKVTDTPPPKELKAEFAKLLAPQAIALVDDKGETMCEVWFRKELPAKADAVKEGMTYRALPEATFVGAFRNPKLFWDYRQQKIKPGVYTMRMGFQPSDGNHMGTAIYNDFVLLLPAAQETGPAPMKQKELFQKASKAAGSGHPACLMLFPNRTPMEKPEIKNRGEGHYALFVKGEAVAGDKKQPLGFGITLVGHAAE